MAFFWIILLCLTVGQEVGIDLVAGSQPASVGSTGTDVNREAEVRSQIDDGLWPVYVLHRGFLGVVQPKYFYELADAVRLTTFEDFVVSLQEDWREWLFYFIGFLICTGVGLLVFVVMTLAGFCVPCCRCCGLCGGRPSKEEGEAANCKEKAYGVFLVVIDCLLVLAVVYVFISSKKLSHQLRGDETVFDNVASGLNRLGPYFRHAVDEVNETVLREYERLSDEALARLRQLPDAVLREVDNATGASEAHEALLNFSKQLRTVNCTVYFVAEQAFHLMEETERLDSNITSVKTSIIDKLNNCGDSRCRLAANWTDRLSINVDYSIVNVSTAVSAIENAIIADFSAYIAAADREIQKISESVENATKHAVQVVEHAATEVQSKVEQSVVDLNTAVEDIVGVVSDISETIQNYEAIVEDKSVADYVFWIFSGVAAIFCLIVFTNVIGILYCCCRRRKNGENCCSCSRASGAYWLLAGNFFTLVSFWLLMLVVIVMFLGGGLSYTEICRNVIYYDDYDSRQVLDVLDHLISNTTGESLMIFETYIACAHNRSLYDAFKLAEKGYDLSQILDMTVLLQQLEAVKASPIAIPSVHLANASLFDVMVELDRAAGLDYDAMKAELRKNVTTVDVEALAELVNATSASGNLTNEIQALLDLSAEEEAIGLAAERTADRLDWLTGVVPPSFVALFGVLNATEGVVNGVGSTLASDVVNRTVDDVIGAVDRLVDDVIRAVETDVARCRVAYEAVTYSVDGACVVALHPFNCCWFCLGCGLFLLIPHLILSFKLSNLFRKTVPYKIKEQPRHDRRNKDDDHNDDNDAGEDNFAFELIGAFEAYRREMTKSPLVTADCLIPRPSASRWTGSDRAGAISHPPPPYIPFMKQQTPDYGYKAETVNVVGMH